MSDLDQTFKDAVLPISRELNVIEERIAEYEAELGTLRVLRTRGRKLLAVLDPSAEQPKREKRGGFRPISDEQVEKILGDIRNLNGGGTFTSPSVSELTGIHTTTISKALKVLHDRGAIRLDHMGGPRNTTKFFALVGGSDE